MSEFLNNKDYRLQQMMKIVQELKQGGKPEVLKGKYQEFLTQVTPHDILNLEIAFLEKGITVSEIKQHIEKQLAIFQIGLENYKWKKPEGNHPLIHYMEENVEVSKYLDILLETVKILSTGPAVSYPDNQFQKIIDILEILPEFEIHYVKKENIIFPYIEKLGYEKPMGVMWSIDDDIRRLWKELRQSFSIAKKPDEETIQDLVMMVNLMKGMIFKEEKIVFPIAVDHLSEEDWKAIQQQSEKEGYAYITVSEEQKGDHHYDENNERKNLNDGLISLGGTGALAIEELILMLNTLPVDITYVDEEDTVRYFSNAKDRIFPRSPAIIGRKVQNCHPPESVHMVEQVIQELKDGKESVDFWINFRGRFIFIRYFAIRDKEGNFKGTLEVSQDLTEARSLQGEKRLLDHLSKHVTLNK